MNVLNKIWNWVCELFSEPQQKEVVAVQPAEPVMVAVEEQQKAKPKRRYYPKKPASKKPKTAVANPQQKAAPKAPVKPKTQQKPKATPKKV